MTRDRKPTSPWRPPTRRTFVAMLGAAAAALALDSRVRKLGTPPDDDRPRSTWTGTTRWVGHC